MLGTPISGIDRIYDGDSKLVIHILVYMEVECNAISRVLDLSQFVRFVHIHFMLP